MTAHRQIHLDFHTPDGVTVGDKLDDNFFSLRSGESRTIGFTLRGGTGSGEPSLLGTSDGMIPRLDESSGKVTSYGALSVMGPVHQLANDPTSERVYGVAGDEMDLGLIFGWDPEAGLMELGRPNLSLLTEPGQVTCNQPDSVAVSPDGRSVAVGCMDRQGFVFVFVDPEMQTL